VTSSAIAKAVEDAVLDYRADYDVEALLRALESIVRAARR
jgi:hypothetical protein